MSYSTAFVAIRNELSTSTHLTAYAPKVVTKVESRYNLSCNSQFRIEIGIPDGVFIINDNETVSDNVEAEDTFGVADFETYLFKIRCGELLKNRSTDNELFDPSETTILTLIDKVKNALADFFFKGNYKGFEYGEVEMVNLPDNQAMWIAEFEFRLMEQVEVRKR